jgi:hypothetical protein
VRGPTGPKQQGFESFFDPCPVAEGEVVAFGPFAIEARPTQHHIPTYAFKIRAGGKLLGVSGDTAFDQDLIAWLAPCDLMIHESNLGPGHTPYESLAALPGDLRARMRVTHLPDGFEPDGAVEPLLQGERLEHPQFKELAEAFEARLPEFDGQWFQKVAFLAFETCETVLYQAASSRSFPRRRSSSIR